MKFDVQTGFARVDITPPLGVTVPGYMELRYADTILDPLEVTCLAIRKDGKTAFIYSVDDLHLARSYTDRCKEEITKATGADPDAIFIHATHTHTSPLFDFEDERLKENDREYITAMLARFVDVTKEAIADLKPSKMGIAFSKAEKVAFNRRYLMKDGSYKTNPGVNNPDIVECAGVIDDVVNVVRFTREDGSDIVLANFGNHPDVIGGNQISADWPGFTRRIFERAVPGCRCIFLNGAQGDINHVNVHPVGGDLNGMFNDFDDVTRGYAHSRHMGNVMAGAILSVYEKVEYVDVDSIAYRQEEFPIPANKPTPDEMPEARYIDEMDKAGRSAELPYKGMMLTTKLGEARRKLELCDAPDDFQMLFSAIRIGKIGLFGIPGEPFVGIGIGLKETKGYDMILPCCLVNANDGYFPMAENYAEGGYEAATSRFKPGVAELIVEKGSAMLESML